MRIPIKSERDNIFILLPGIPARSARGFFGYCSVALLRSETGWVLFDTGHYGDRELLIEALSKQRLSPVDISYVVISHLHYDHCLNLPLFPQATIILGEKELEYARSVHAGERVDHAIPDSFESLLTNGSIWLVQSEKALDPKISVFETPGHTPGSIALLFQGAERTILCGDAVKNAWEFMNGCSDMVLGDPKAACESIQQIRKCGTVFVPGHDRAFRKAGDGLEFITRIDWSITAQVYPESRDSELYRLEA